MKILITVVAALILTGSAAAQAPRNGERSVKLIAPIKIKQKPPVARLEAPKGARPTAPKGVHSLPLVG